MKISNAFPSKYLRAADLQDRQIEVVMHRVEMENVGDDDKKPVLHFVRKQKGLVLNKVNSRTIAAAYGDDTDAPSHIVYAGFTSLDGDTGGAPSPSGTYLALTNASSGTAKIIRAAADGSARRVLTTGYQPDWQPLP